MELHKQLKEKYLSRLQQYEQFINDHLSEVRENCHVIHDLSFHEKLKTVKNISSFMSALFEYWKQAHNLYFTYLKYCNPSQEIIENFYQIALKIGETITSYYPTYKSDLERMQEYIYSYIYHTKNNPNKDGFLAAMFGLDDYGKLIRKLRSDEGLASGFSQIPYDVIDEYVDFRYIIKEILNEEFQKKNIETKTLYFDKNSKYFMQDVEVESVNSFTDENTKRLYTPLIP